MSQMIFLTNKRIQNFKIFFYIQNPKTDWMPNVKKLNWEDLIGARGCWGWVGRWTFLWKIFLDKPVFGIQQMTIIKI